MIWIDTDLIIPPDALVRLVKMSNACPLLAGIYRRAMLDKDHQFLLTRRTIDEWATLEELRAHADGGVTRVSMSAGGFSIVRREVYEAVERAFGRPWYLVYDREANDWCFGGYVFHAAVRKAGHSRPR